MCGGRQKRIVRCDSLEPMDLRTQKEKPEDALYCWDVVERSRGGHERRRRLFRQMTEAAARRWEADHDGKLERVDESKVQSGPFEDARRRAYMAPG